METKGLNDIFNEIIKKETKDNEYKKYLTFLKTDIETKERQLSEAMDQLKDINEKIESKTEEISKTICENTFIESEIDIICKQLAEIESKSEDLKQKIVELNSKRNQRINELNEKSFTFMQTFGPNGCQTKQIIKTKENVKNLVKIRDNLKLNVEKMKSDLNDFELNSTQNNSLKSDISLKTKTRNELFDENFELNCVEKQLKNQLIELNRKPETDPELIELKRKIRSIDNNERNDGFSAKYQKTSELFGHLVLSDARNAANVTPIVPKVGNKNISSSQSKPKGSVDELIPKAQNISEMIVDLTSSEDNHSNPAPIETKLGNNDMNLSESESKEDKQSVDELQRLWEKRRFRRQHIITED